MTTELKENRKQEMQLPTGVEYTRPRKVFMPAVDIYESMGNIEVLAEMPGVDENSIDITLEKNVLTITGAVEPCEHSGYTLGYSEYESGDYKRVFELSNEIDRDGIQALVKNGVLQLTLPKSKELLPKKITVKVQ